MLVVEDFRTYTRGLDLCQWQTGVAQLVRSSRQAIAMKWHSILPQLVIFITFPEFRQVNIFKGSEGEANVLRGHSCHTGEGRGLLGRV